MVRPLAACGSPSAYRRHLRRHEPVDTACRLAKRAYDREARKAAAVARAARVAAVAATLPAVSAVPVTVDGGRISRPDVLEEMLQQCRETVAVLVVADPSRAYLAMAEQRAILRELAEIDASGQVKVVSLADQLAAARAARAARVQNPANVDQRTTLRSGGPLPPG